MKKLNRLQINSERLMKSYELMTLRGGYGACTCTCFNPNAQCAYGYLLSADGACAYDCGWVFPGASGECGNGYPMPPC